jgi:FemAB-related protein (PEP-CTERM system-associated)
VIAVSPGVRDAVEWDAFVAGQSGATFCHLSGWRDVMRDALGHECHYLEARFDSGALAGVLPLVRVKSPVLGHYVMSMPFLNSGGPIGTTAAQLALVNAAVEFARNSRADLLELRAKQPVPGTLKVSSRKITVHVSLPEHPDKLWNAFPAKLRSQIRRPQKEGFEVRFGPGEVEPFYSVFTRNMRDLGTPVLPRRLFTDIATVFPGIVEFGTVYKGAEPIAAGCGFAWGGEFEITWASALREHNRSAPNMLLYWSFMQRMIERGIDVFDLGRCTPNGGTHTFKRQWGGTDVPLPWAQWSARNVDATPSPNTPMFRLAANCWSRLPLGVTNRLGPLIARRLP